jgi:predicted phosphoadenosine phosphosulfate sulfurtransferase
MRQTAQPMRERPDRQMIMLPLSVYAAAMKRLDVVFSEFDHILVAFSGGKDSGVLLNLVIRYMRERGITRKIGVFHQDFEAQYTATTEYVEQMLTSNLDLIDPYWCCMPCSCKTATSMHEQYWVPWHPDQQDIWVRSMPEYPGVINLDNHQFDFYKFGMMQEDFYAAFAPWYHRQQGGTGKTICLVGIRAQESLNRWRAITGDKGMYQGHAWTTRNPTERTVYAGYPLYDWKTEDIWTANARYGFPYNHIYDLFAAAGLSIHEMRVASPFNDWAISSLKLYRAIEPGIWGRMVGRVNGANFTAIYGGTHAVGWKHVTLPPGHTWQSFVQFLLSTLPPDTRKTYEEHFATSLTFWAQRGGVLSAETIAELQAMGISIRVRGKTAYKTEKEAVIFDEYPDDWQGSEFQLVPSYKRMAICILKNDHLCKFMGFSHTKRELERRKATLDKYRNL